jgi:hypothetical protein
MDDGLERQLPALAVDIQGRDEPMPQKGQRRCGPVLSRALSGLDDQDDLTAGPELGPGEEHATDPSALGLCPGERTSVVVSEASGQHLLPMCPV